MDCEVRFCTTRSVGIVTEGSRTIFGRQCRGECVRRKKLYFSHPVRVPKSMMFPRSIPWVSWCAARALRKITLGRAVRAVLVPSLISTVAVMPPVLDVKKSKKKIPHQGLEPRTFALGGLYGTECNPNAIAIKLMRLFLHLGPKLLINSIDVSSRMVLSLTRIILQ